MTEEQTATRDDPRILVIDSGLGGLSVLSALAATMPFADYTYLADDARFPYGDLDEDELTDGLIRLAKDVCREIRPDLIVVACNTASTVALEALRGEVAVPVVGVVPGIRPAVRATRTGRIGVLATPGTIRRSYTADLIRQHAQDCAVELVPCAQLAGMAEKYLLEGDRSDPEIAKEIDPVFSRPGGADVDVVVLGCTHYPLVLPVLQAVVRPPVLWINPAPAVARRAMHLLGQEWQNCLAGEVSAPGVTGTGVRFLATGGGAEKIRKGWLRLTAPGGGH